MSEQNVMTKSQISAPQNEVEAVSFLAEAMPQLAWIARPDGHVFWYNKRWYEYTGTDLEQMEGWGWEKVHHPDHIERVVSFVKQAWKKPEPWELTFPLRSASGQWRWFLTRAIPFKNATGEIIWWLGTNTDVNDQVEAESALRASEERYRLLTELSPNVVWTADPQGNITYANDPWYEYTGLTLDQTQKNAWLTIVHPDDQPRAQTAWSNAVLEKSTYKIEMRLKRASDGSYRWFFVSAKPVKVDSDTVVQWAGVAVDIHERMVALEAGEESQRILKTITDNAASCLFMMDKSGHPTFMNPAAEKLTGYKLDEIKDKPLHYAVHYKKPDGSFYPMEECPIDNAQAELKPLQNQEEIFVDKAGRLYPVSYSVAPLEKEGEVVGSVLEFRDITEQKRAEEERQTLASVVENASDFIGIARPNMQGIFLNTAGRKLVGVEDVDISKTQVLDYFAEEHRDKVMNEVVPAVQRTGYWEGELLFKHFKTGARIPVLYNIFPILSQATGELLAYATVTRDITERVKAELALKKAKEEAERANQLKSAFLANMSHEIRTPLGVIIGFADLIADPEVDQDERKQYAAILRRNGDQLSVLINDILDLSKVEAGYLKVDLVDFSLKALIEEVLSALRMKAAEKGLTLRADFESNFDGRIVSDPVRVRQILWNLVGNAIKFTEHGQITIKVEKSAGSVQIDVQDTGIGIGEEDQRKLFRPFSQSDESITRKYGGTGLGLALSKRLSVLLGGELVLKQSAPSAGSTFCLTIKNYLESQQQVKQSATKTMLGSSSAPTIDSTRSKELAGVRVLLTEDSPDNQQFISRLLTKNGAAVEIANNGEEGIERALKGNHDIVLMDIQMPVVDGYTATQRLREQGYAKPIIALTAHVMNDVRVKCLDVGCNDHLPKPLNPKQLIETILNHVSH